MASGQSCPVCSVVVDEGNKAISCDMCQEWYHITCVGISVQLYSGIQKYEGIRKGELLWYCEKCSKVGAGRLVNTIAKVIEKQDKLDKGEQDMLKKWKEMSEEIKGLKQNIKDSDE